MKQRGLVFIDMLLDTVYGTIRQLSGEAAELLVNSDAYRDRHVDNNFHELTNGVIDDAEFQQLYAARDIDTIFYAKLSNFVFDLRQDMLEGRADMLRGAQVESLALDINLWPYDVDAESAEVIRRSVEHYMPQEVVVRTVYIEPKDLTPRMLDHSYEMMAIYNHEDWLGHHYMTTLLEYPIPTFVLITPMIASSGVVPDATPEIRNPFLCRSAMLIKTVALQYIATSRVCYNPEIIRLVEQSRQQRVAALLDQAPPEQSEPEH